MRRFDALNFPHSPQAPHSLHSSHYPHSLILNEDHRIPHPHSSRSLNQSEDAVPHHQYHFTQSILPHNYPHTENQKDDENTHVECKFEEESEIPHFNFKSEDEEKHPHLNCNSEDEDDDEDTASIDVKFVRKVMDVPLSGSMTIS